MAATRKERPLAVSLMGSAQTPGGSVTGGPVIDDRSGRDCHADHAESVTVTINGTGHSGPAIDEVEVESGLVRDTTRNWSGELTLFHLWRRHTLNELSEDCISHWTERQHSAKTPSRAGPALGACGRCWRLWAARCSQGEPPAGGAATPGAEVLEPATAADFTTFGHSGAQRGRVPGRPVPQRLQMATTHDVFHLLFDLLHGAG